MEFDEVNDEYRERMAAFESSCQDGTGNAVACHQVGEFLSLVTNEYDRAAKVFAKNCTELKHPPSCFNLGRLFLSGKGVEQSDLKAANHFDTACKAKHPAACFHAGYMLLHGARDLKSDFKKASELLDLSCKRGVPDACNALSIQLLRQDGKGPVARDAPRAKKLLDQGCQLAHGPCCFNLAIMYKNGDDGVPSDQEKFEIYKQKTEELVKQYGEQGGMTKVA